MVAEQADGCPQDFEPIFYRVWNGTKDFCSDGEVESCNGEMVKGIPPINMTSFSGKVACGKRGGVGEGPKSAEPLVSKHVDSPMI